jgi:hypothetical protein
MESRVGVAEIAGGLIELGDFSDDLRKALLVYASCSRHVARLAGEFLMSNVCIELSMSSEEDEAYPTRTTCEGTGSSRRCSSSRDEPTKIVSPSSSSR